VKSATNPNLSERINRLYRNIHKIGLGIEATIKDDGIGSDVTPDCGIIGSEIAIMRID
jgi:hypothetical protein